MTIDRLLKAVPLFVVFMMFALDGCVNLPNDGQTAPDYRSVIRYFHAGRGVDTVSFLESTSTITTNTVQLTPLGVSDTAREAKTTVFTRATYKRVLIDYASSFDVWVDNSSVGSLSQGGVTPYLDTPSGSRKVQIRGTGRLVDSVAIRDTNTSIVRDTLRTGGSRVTELQSKKEGTFVFPASGNVSQIIDTAASPISFDTQNKATLFLVGDTSASNISSRSALIRFGRIKYLRSVERRTFDPTGLPDTALIRFVNASKNIGGAIDFKRVEQPTADQSNLNFSGISGYRKFSARVDTTYAFKIMRGSTTIDSARVSVSKLVRYTTVVLDSANSWSIKTYRDE